MIIPFTIPVTVRILNGKKEEIIMIDILAFAWLII
jgi:hypothetical protein|tara:strand:- start:748 stop:852 length:105 start_codon:yes stop_codon:yes gene_type:complete